MAKLIVTLNGVAVRDFPLEGERISIGRRPTNDVHLDDPTVSSEHAAITVLDEPTITDLDSTNGTYVNGKQIKKTRLYHGDLIRIGKHDLRFIDEKSQDFSATVVLQPGGAPDATRNARMTVISGPRKGEVLDINRNRTVVGMTGGQAVVLLREGDVFSLLPMGIGQGAVGLRVNGKPVEGHSLRLKNRDVVEIDDNRFKFEI